MRRPPEAVVFFFVPAAFYAWTCAPGLGMADTAILTDQMLRLELSAHVNSHNFTVIIGWLFSRLPFGAPEYRVNLASVFVGALAVTVFFSCLRRLFAARLTAWIGSAFLMISHSMWWHSTLVECYAANALFTALFLRIAIEFSFKKNPRLLYWLFFVSGFSIFNHVQMGALAIGAALALLYYAPLAYRDSLKRAMQCAVSYALGSTPWLVIVVRDYLNSESLAFTLREAFIGPFGHIMFKGEFFYGLKELGFLLLQQTPNLYLLLIPAGIGICLKSLPGVSLMLLGVALPNVLFFMFYNTWDRFAFLLPVFIILIFCGAFGLDALWSWLRRQEMRAKWFWALLLALSLAFPPYFYANLARWGDTPGSFWHARFNNNYSANLVQSSEYSANPNKRSFTDVHDFALKLFQRLPPNSIYIDDDGRTFYPVEFYQRHAGFRPDLRLVVINSWGIKNWGASKSDLASIIRLAYWQNHSLFVSSLMPPIRTFMEPMPDRERFQFEKFPLGDKRWIYRLITRKEQESGKAQETLHTARTAIRFAPGLKRIDLDCGNVAQLEGGPCLTQPMHHFGSLWSGYAQVLLPFKHPGGSAVFDLEFSGDLDGLFEFVFTAAPDYGIVALHLNGRLLLPAVDLYADKIGLKVVRTGSVKVNSGINSFSLTVSGKNSKSASYFSGIDSIEFIKAP